MWNNKTPKTDSDLKSKGSGWGCLLSELISDGEGTKEGRTSQGAEKEWAVSGGKKRKNACARNPRDSMELEKKEQRGRTESWLPSTYLSCVYDYLLSRCLTSLL